MLKTLTVWNFALLEQVQIEFGAGLNILTGETGAGKSILIDALGAILGQRMSSEAIRTGCDWLRVEAVFSVCPSADLQAFLQEQAIEEEEDTLIITRQITRNGRNMILVNGCHITLGTLRQLGAFLVDIHGQNENLALLKVENQFALLDGAAPEILRQKEVYGAGFRQWQRLCQDLAQKEQSARDYAQRIDMLRWQDKEIEEAHLEEQEEERLEAEIKRLSHAEKIAEAVQSSYGLFDGTGKQTPGILTELSEVKQHLLSMARFDDSLQDAQKMLEDAYCQLQEVSYAVRDYAENMDFQPQKLDQLQNRMEVIYRLRKKYGATVKDVLLHQQRVRKELAQIENYDEDVAALQKAIVASRQQVEKEAGRLTAMRTEMAAKLSREIGVQLLALGMPEARFRLVISPRDDFSPQGADALAMLFSANLGEAERPVQKVASGGELSRIALAIKTVAATKEDAVDSMVFDEIDTGIGGKTAQMVAERIARVAAYKQVLCITHLPQIACMADLHLYIHKETREGTTVTKVRSLTEGERVNEIARMASGVDVTAAALDNAREMLDHAVLKKTQFQKEKEAAKAPFSTKG